MVRSSFTIVFGSKEMRTQLRPFGGSDLRLQTKAWGGSQKHIEGSADKFSKNKADLVKCKHRHKRLALKEKEIHISDRAIG